jgi:SAM-dependent methyltransferase
MGRRQPYDGAFFDWQEDGALTSARVVAPLVLDLVPVRTIVDIGCGRGAWLLAFTECGAERVLGIDGDYVDRSRLLISPSDFVARDLIEPLGIEERFDLVVSLEVAEHLPSACARAFVRQLTELGPIVLFSAAVPSQGGTNHVNEQWPEYWAALFAEVGYRPIDCIRPAIWDDRRVEPWYAQNTILFATQEAIERSPSLRGLAAEPARPLSIVHPRLFLGPRRLRMRQLASSARASILGPIKTWLSARVRRARRRIGGGRVR